MPFQGTTGHGKPELFVGARRREADHTTQLALPSHVYARAFFSVSAKLHTQRHTLSVQSGIFLFRRHHLLREIPCHRGYTQGVHTTTRVCPDVTRRAESFSVVRFTCALCRCGAEPTMEPRGVGSLAAQTSGSKLTCANDAHHQGGSSCAHGLPMNQAMLSGEGSIVAIELV